MHRMDDELVLYSDASTVMINRHYDAEGEPIKSILVFDKGIVGCEWFYERKDRRGFTYMDMIAAGHDVPVEDN